MIGRLRYAFRFSSFTSKNIFSNQIIAQHKSLSSSEVTTLLQDTPTQKNIWENISSQHQDDILKGFVHKVSQSKQIAESLSSCTGKQVSQCYSELEAAVRIMNHQLQNTKAQESYPSHNAYRFHPFDFSTSIFDHRHPILAACAYLVIACRTNTPLLLRPSPYVLPPILQLEALWNQNCDAKIIRCLVDAQLDPKHKNSVIKSVLTQTQGFMSFWGRISDGLDFHYYSSQLNEVFRENEFLLTSSDSAYVMKDISAEQLKKVAKIIGRACFSNCGHNFNSIKRVFADQEVVQQLTDLLCLEAQLYSVDSLMENNIGEVYVNKGLLAPFLFEGQFKQSQKLIQELNTTHKEEFACLAGGDSLSLKANNHVLNFIKPSVFRVQKDYPNFPYQNQECMLPICFVSAVDSPQSCIEKINSSIFGATTTLFTNNTDLTDIQNFGSRVQVGTVNVNSWDLSEGVCYSGRKRSGKGFSLSPLSYNNLTRSKSVIYG